MPGELDIAQQWIAKAKNDLLNADNNFRSVDFPTLEDAREARQSAERVLNWLQQEMPELFQ